MSMHLSQPAADSSSLASSKVVTHITPQQSLIGELQINDRPFLILGGELGNSNASHPGVLAQALDRCEKMHLNTVLLPVYWDLIEPNEGQYDFSLLESAIRLARERNLRLVLLWFGTWKNCMSCYIPGWMKRDTNRFFRAQKSDGTKLEVISPQCQSAKEADKRAFCQMMSFIKQFDAAESTVIMIQVENEIGMIPEARDHSPQSNLAYQANVPEALLTLLLQNKLGTHIQNLWHRHGSKTRGSWSDVFGQDPLAQEIFAAWEFAIYVQSIAAAGKKIYHLPMFVNAALIRPGYHPGQYAAGGPLPHLLHVWNAAAPAIDFLSPDIYFPNFIEWSEKYTHNQHTLFIPEMAASTRAPANALYALGQHAAIGVAPFSIENVSKEKEAHITSCYQLLRGASGVILNARKHKQLAALSPVVDFDWNLLKPDDSVELAGVRFQATFDAPPGSPRPGSTTPDGQPITTLPTLGAGRWDTPPHVPLGAAMIINIAPDEFFVIGMGVKITFHLPASSAQSQRITMGIESVQEGTFDTQGNWSVSRWLNGDETHQGRHIHLYDGNWTAQRVKLYRY